MSVKRVEVTKESQWNALSLPLQFCISSMFVQENPERKKNSEWLLAVNYFDKIEDVRLGSKYAPNVYH